MLGFTFFSLAFPKPEMWKFASVLQVSLISEICTIWVYDVTAPVAFYAHSAHTSDPFFTLFIAIPPSQYQVELQVKISIHSAKNGNCVIYSHSSCSKPAWISTLEHDIQQKKEINTGSLPCLNCRCLFNQKGCCKRTITWCMLIFVLFRCCLNTTERLSCGSGWGDLMDTEFQQRVEDAIALLRQEIQRELKIKEAAERLRRAVTNRKNAADVDGQLRALQPKTGEAPLEAPGAECTCYGHTERYYYRWEICVHTLHLVYIRSCSYNFVSVV